MLKCCTITDDVDITVSGHLVILVELDPAAGTEVDGQVPDKSRATYEQIGQLKPNATVGIVGAGLSGIEIASELRESRGDLKIKLFDRGERILPMYPARLSAYVKRWFDENDVEVIPNSNIVKVETDRVYNNNDSHDVDMCV